MLHGGRQGGAGGNDRDADALVKTFEENDRLYTPTIDPGTETRLHEDIKAAWSAYLTESRHVRELLAAEKVAEAKAYLLEHMIPAGARAEAAVHAGMDYNVAAMRRLTHEVDASYANGRVLVISFMVFAVDVAVLAGMFLVRSIATPVQAMTEAMRRLAARDMTAEIPAQDRTDEIGQMAEAVQVFKDGMIAADRLAE